MVPSQMICPSLFCSTDLSFSFCTCCYSSLPVLAFPYNLPLGVEVSLKSTNLIILSENKSFTLYHCVCLLVPMMGLDLFYFG
jgi:hypothetical protein